MKNNSTPSQDIYDEYYFKHACGGHQEFLVSKGEKLTPWMSYLLTLANLKSSEKVLDLGSGRGEIAYHAAKQGCFSIGLDYSMAAIRVAKILREKQKDSDNSFHLILSDARNLPFPKMVFDVVFMLDIVEHLGETDLLIVLKSVYDSLSPGGHLLIHTMPNKNYYRYAYPLFRLFMMMFGKNLPKDPRKRFYHGECHVNIQTPKTLKSCLESAGFKRIKIRLAQLSGSKYKRFFCQLFPFKYILANDIIALVEKTS